MGYLDFVSEDEYQRWRKRKGAERNIGQDVTPDPAWAAALQQMGRSTPPHIMPPAPMSEQPSIPVPGAWRPTASYGMPPPTNPSSPPLPITPPPAPPIGMLPYTAAQAEEQYPTTLQASGVTGGRTTSAPDWGHLLSASIAEPKPQPPPVPPIPPLVSEVYPTTPPLGRTAAVPGIMLPTELGEAPLGPGLTAGLTAPVQAAGRANEAMRQIPAATEIADLAGKSWQTAVEDYMNPVSGLATEAIGGPAQAEYERRLGMNRPPAVNAADWWLGFGRRQAEREEKGVPNLPLGIVLPLLPAEWAGLGRGVAAGLRGLPGEAGEAAAATRQAAQSPALRRLVPAATVEATTEAAQTPTLYRGMGRAIQGTKNGLPRANNQGVIFTSTDRDIALKYADWGGTAPGGLMEFTHTPSAKIANVSEPGIVEDILNRARRFYPDNPPTTYYWKKSDLNDPAWRKAVAAEIANGQPGWGELALMDDPAIIQAVKSMGYQGVTDGTNYAFVTGKALQPLAAKGMSLPLGAATEAAPAKRFYHGTGSTFEAPDAAEFDPNGLYGPGYYLTDNPEVATGYANARGVVSTDPALADLLGSALSKLKSGASLQNFTDAEVSKLTSVSGNFSKLLRVLNGDRSSLIKELEGYVHTSGPQIRAVDVPEHLKLLDVDAPADDAVYEAVYAIARALPDHQSTGFGAGITEINDLRPITNQDVYETLVRNVPDRDAANRVLQKAGYDGISYPGGQIMPLKDAAGNPIEHQAVVIFPESLPKITNALSGRPMGTPPEVGLGLASAATGYDANATPEENARNMAVRGIGGFVAGRGLRTAGEAIGSRGRVGPFGDDVGILGLGPKTPPTTDPALRQLRGALKPDSPSLSESVSTATNRFVREFYDRLAPLKVLEKETGIPTHQQAQIVPGAVAAGEDNIRRFVLPALTPVGPDLNYLEEYMVLRRAEDILAQNASAKLPGGLVGQPSVDQAMQALKAELGPDRLTKIQTAADDIWRLNDELVLQPYLREGIINKTQYDAMQAKHPHYLPYFRRDFNIENPTHGWPTAQPGSVGSTGIKRMSEEGSQRALDEPLARWEGQVVTAQTVIARNRAAKGIVEALQTKDPKLARVLKPNQAAEHSVNLDTVSYYEDGKKVAVQVPREFAAVAKGFETEPSNILIRALGILAAPLRYGAVGLNTAFIPKNIIRDAMSAYYREGVVPLSHDYIRGWIAAIAQNTDFSDAARAGALMSGFVEQSRSTVALKRVAQAGGIRVGSVGDALLLVPRVIQRLNEVAEQAPRIATFEKLRAKGVSELEAAVRARDVTVDFSKSGNVLKLVNTAVPFLNAAVQGTANTVRTMIDNPKGALLRSAPLAVMSILTWLWNQRFESANTIPDYEYAYGWPIIIGEGLRNPDPKNPGLPPERFPIRISIPKGPYGAAITAPVELALRLAWANDDRSVAENIALAAGQAALSMSPIEPSISAVLPPLAVTGFAVQTGVDPFRKEPIVPQREQDRPPELQYGSDTSKAAIALGEKFKISPRMIDFAVKDYAGGVGQQALWLLDLGLGALGYHPETMGAAFQQQLSPTEQLSHTPVVSSFVKTSSGQQENRQYQKLDDAVTEMNRYLADIPELRRLGISIGPVSSTVRNLPLTINERATYQQLANDRMRVALAEVLADQDWQSAALEVQKKIIQQTLERARAQAAGMILGQVGEAQLEERATRASDRRQR